MNETTTQEPVTMVTGQPIADIQLPAVADHHGQAVEKAERKQRKPRGTESIINIAIAIGNVTGEVGIIAKAGYNKFHGYKFAQMQDVLQRLTPLISKHGLIIMQTEVSRTMLDQDRAVAVEYEFTIAHTSGEIWPDRPRQTGLCRCRDSKGGFDDKAFNKAHTAARKYFLLSLFQIATGEEDDADTHETGRQPPPVKPSPIKTKVLEQVGPYPPVAYDPNTGEILSDAADTPTAAKDAAPSPGRGGAAPSDELAAILDNPPKPLVSDQKPLSIEDMAREAASRGEAVFRAFYKKRSPAEQGQINVIGDELRQLMTTAKEKANVQKQ